MKKLILIAFILLLCLPAYAQEKIATDSADYWCGAVWPPVEGQDRTHGMDVNGDICIKIMHTEAVCPVCEECPAPNNQVSKPQISVSLKMDENGSPILEASCPNIGKNEWDYRIRCAELGGKPVLRTKDGDVYVLCENLPTE